MNKNHFMVCMGTALVLMAMAFAPKHLTSVSGSQQRSSSMRDQNRKKIEQKKASFKSGRDLLLEHGVPFDPDLLMEPGFQKRLAPVFAKMPEFRSEIQVRFSSTYWVMASILQMAQVELTSMLIQTGLLNGFLGRPLGQMMLGSL